MRGLITTALLLLIKLAVAQSPPDSVRIGEVVVTAPLVEKDFIHSRVRMDSMALSSAIFQTMAELLAQNSPVFIKTYGRGSMAVASFRGTAAAHAPVLWNGMPVHSPLRGMADVSLLPVLFTDEVSLFSGAGALNETGGALGGALQLSSRADWHTNNRIQLLTEIGSFGSSSWLGRFQTGKRNFRSVTKGIFDSSRNQFSYYNVGVIPARRDTLKNAAYAKSGILQEFYLRLKEAHMASVRLWYQESQRELPPLMTFEGSHRTEEQNDRQIRGLAEFRNFSHPFNYQLSSGFSYLNLAYFLSSGPMQYINANSVSEEFSQFHQARWSMNIKPRLTLNGTASLQQHRVTVENRIETTSISISQIHADWLLRVQHELTHQLGWYALLRGVWYDDGKVPFVPAAGAHFSHRPGHTFQTKVNLARNFHRPTLNDLYWLPGGNPNLRPEEGWLADLSFRHALPDGVSFAQQLTLFYARIHHWILWQPSPRGAWYWEAGNLREVLSRGIEYQMNGSVTIRSLHLLFNGNLAYTRTTHEDQISSADLSRGKQLIYVPPLLGNLYVAAQYGAWTFKGDLTYTGKRYTQTSMENSLFEHVLTPFWLSSVALERSFTLSSLVVAGRAKIDNLFNVDYQQMLWRPMPGRHYAVSLSIGGVW